MSSEADNYAARGSRCAAAWQILVEGCEVPPSLEVFEHQFMLETRGNPGLSVEGMARRISESYHRVTGFFRDQA